MITMSVSGTSPEFKKAIVKSISSPIRAESLPDLLHKVSSARPKDSTRSIAMPWLEDVMSAFWSLNTALAAVSRVQAIGMSTPTDSAIASCLLAELI